MPERIGLLLCLDHHLPRALVEAGDEELPVATAPLAAAMLPASAHPRLRPGGARRRPVDDLVDALMGELERVGDLAERAAGGVELLDRVVVVHAYVCGLALEVDKALPRLLRLGQNLFV